MYVVIDYTAASLTNQTITVTSHAPASAVNGTSFPVAATASSGLTVAITATGGCSIAGGTVTMTSDTTACVVHYNQAGNGSYNPAPEVTETATAVAAAPACTIDTTANLVANPCFEQGSGNTATNWSFDYWGTTPTFSIVGNAHSGTRAAQVQITSYTEGDSKWLFQTVAVQPGEYYTFSDWYKSDVPTEVDVYYDPGVGENIVLMADNIAAASSWTQFSSSFLVPNGVTSVVVAHILASNGTLTTDDYSLIKGTAPVFSQGMVTLTFDDGWKSFFTNGVPVLNTAGLKATAYLNSGPILDNYTDYMTTGDVASLVTQGYDIGGHTRDHLDLTLPATDLNTQINTDRSTLQGWASPQTVDTFAYPFGSYNDDVVSHVTSAGYGGARTVDQGYNFTDTDPYKLKIQHVTNITTIDEVKGWIDTAKAEKVWLILMFHVVKPGSDISQCTGDEECTTADFLQQVANYIVSQNISVPTMHQGLAVLHGSAIPDTTAPQVVAHDPVSADATSASGATVSFTVTATDNIDANPVVTCTPASGSTFPIGPTTVSCTAKDASNNTSSPATFVVTVVDTAPTITLSGDAEVTAEYGSDYVDAGATATDAVDGDLTSSIVTANPINTAVLGDYAVTYNVSDSHSNAAVQVTRTVHVVARAVTVTADNASKVYGELDPASLTYQVTTGSLVGSDSFTGAMARVSGEAVGPYAITQGTLALNPNYTITFVPGTFTITAIPGAVTLSNMEYAYDGTPKAATVTTDPGTLTTTVTYEGAGETIYPLSTTAPTNAGTYAVVATVDAGQGYEGSATGELVINKVAVEVTPTAGQSKLYKNPAEADPVLAYTYDASLLVGADVLTGALSREDSANNNIGTYEITKGTLAISDNYSIMVVSGVTFEIQADPSNLPPVVSAPASVSVAQGSSVTVDIAATDPEAGTLTWMLHNPAHGVLSGTPSDGAASLSYTPDAYDVDSFTVDVSDGNSTTSATVNIIVNPTPVCPAGYTSNGVDCTPDDTTPTSGCPADTAFNAESGLCESTLTGIPATTDLSCPEGSTLNGENMCVANPVDPVAPTCTVGSYNPETNQCEDNSGETPVIDPAVCPDGSLLNNDTDMCETPAGEPTAPTETLSCPEGYTGPDGESNCAPDPIEPSTPVCPANAIDNGDGTCTPSNIPLQCIDGYHFEDSVCVVDVLYTVSASAGEHGNISPSGDVSVIKGGSQSFTITADSGYHIADVLVDDASVGTDSTFEFTNVTSGHTIVVSFAQDETQTTTTHHRRSGGGGSSKVKPGLVLGASTGSSLTDAQIQAILDLLKSFSADQSVIDSVSASLHGQASSGTSAGAATSGFVFTQTLTLGSSGNEVTELQRILIAGGFLHIASPSGYFGQLTQEAVKAYQAAHNLPAVGIVGPLTRAALNSNTQLVLSQQ